MAVVGEPISLCTCFNERDLLSVDENDVPEQIIVTCKSKSIYVFKVDDQRAVQSWSLRKEWVITSPVQCTDDKNYITVINHQDVRTWRRDELNFEKSERQHFKFKIQEILSVGTWRPVVVCENGTVDFIDKIKTSYSIKSPVEGKVIKCSGITCAQNTLCVICLTKQNDGSVVVYHHWFSKTSPQWKSHTTFYNGTEGTEYIHSQARASGSGVMLTILYSEGNIHTFNLAQHSEEFSDLTMLKISGVHKHTSMVVLDSMHVAVGVYKNDEEGVGIFDTQFGTLLTWRALPSPAQSKLQLYCCYGNLIVPCGNTLYTYSYACQPSTIASILGQLREPKRDKAQQSFGGHFSWSAETNEVKEIESNEEISTLFKILCEKSGTSQDLGADSFMQNCSTLMEKLSADHNSCWFGSQEMTELAKLCLTRDSILFIPPIKALIKLHVFPPSLLPQLVDFLIKHGQIPLLHMTLISIPELPESCLCKALHYYLTCRNKKLAKASKQFNVTLSHHMQEPHWAFQFFVNAVLLLPYNDVFLVDCLRSLPFQHALNLLKYLQYLLGMSIKEEVDVDTGSAPSMLQIVEWICLLLDAHVTQLIISPDTRLLLLKLHSLVESQVKFYDDLVYLDALLQQLRAKSTLPKKQEVGHYCIEVLHVE